MALFSLLIALLFERAQPLAQHWQFEYWYQRAIDKIRPTLEPTALTFQILALVTPASLTYLLLQLGSEALYGLVSLALWVLSGLLCLSCFNYRRLYKQYLLSVCHGDSQASYHLAAQLADVDSLDVGESVSLGTEVGRQLIWINYRYYCATVLMMVIGGPVAVVFYATVRSYDLLIKRQRLPAVGSVRLLLAMLDWLPARIIALGYVLVGNFSHAIGLWFSLLFEPKITAEQLIGDVATAAEQVSDIVSEQAICMQKTCQLVKFAKRNLIFLLSVVAVMTIVGLLT
jgi:AmpE protein